MEFQVQRLMIKQKEQFLLKKRSAPTINFISGSFSLFELESFSSINAVSIYKVKKISDINAKCYQIVLFNTIGIYTYSQQINQMASSNDRKSLPQMREINVEISNPHMKNDIKAIQNENRIIKKQNVLLRRQLDSLSNKLDVEIRKKMEEKVKPWNRPGDSTYLQLQNAHKQCEIYKREANFYKKRLQNLQSGQQKTVELALCKDYLATENKNLKQELKSLRKISKFQQRGLQQMGVQGYLKVVDQNKRLNEEIKKLNKQLDQYRRGVYSVDYEDSQQESAQRSNAKRFVTSTNSRSIKTDPRESKSKLDNYNTQSNEMDELIQKSQKDYRKIKSLISQRNKLRQQLAVSRLQLIQKDKQIDSLKNRITNLRKNNRFMHSQLGVSRDNKDIEQQKQETKSQSHRKEAKQQPAKYRVWSKNKTHSVNDTNHDQPRKQERGSSPLNTYKWNHQSLASKIVEVQVLLHEQGHIKDLNIKYKKGETKRLNSHNASKFQSFGCRPGEFIKHISGCFSDGYLQCLSLITSEKRHKVFGNSFLLEGSEQQSQKFQFLIDQNEFPGALYGQNDEKGVRKLGCLIMKQ